MIIMYITMVIQSITISHIQKLTNYVKILKIQKSLKTKYKLVCVKKYKRQEYKTLQCYQNFKKMITILKKTLFLR